MDSGNQINFRIEMDKFPLCYSAIDQQPTKWQKGSDSFQIFFCANNSRIEARPGIHVCWNESKNVWIGHLMMKKQNIPDSRVSFEVLSTNLIPIYFKKFFLAFLCEHVSGLFFLPFFWPNWIAVKDSLMMWLVKK